MPGFESIIDQQKPIGILRALLEQSAVAHALLFTGIDGVGKQTTARLFAMAVNCASYPGDAASRVSADSVPCGQCVSCRKIISGNHPDVLHIQPQGNLIRIDQIRALGRTLAMKPYEARYRVVMISDAQRMNPESANALLKMLEEPPEQTLLVLTASETSDLLPTVVSRCQRVRFNPVSIPGICRELVSHCNLSPDVARVVAAMAGGSMGRAIAMSRSDWLERRNWLVRELAGLRQAPISVGLALAQRLAQDKDRLAESLEVMLSWFRDGLVRLYGPGKIINQDLIPLPDCGSQNENPEILLSKIQAVRAAEKAVAANANLRLTIEGLILRLSET
ncbi:MAG: DNA polymerase III subunit delta' [Desulfobacterales bacterium]|nr:DNA polymerase III subunit delta' [Desulfobacterales bacterium]MDD3080860.1 DNA polymerase III subunit delta' [Desulfobacterales bacterium]MDD3949847.1 DNA polymerase III subunit delta' [Desulfobacterales bacterium]MDD4462701.1 DNA polymerase III subunit delta' [Desulfobacterales bacterium]